jgi:hypothetical protein
MRVGAQVLDAEKGTIELQIEDDCGRDAIRTFDGHKILDNTEVEYICKSLNLLTAAVSGCVWEPDTEGAFAAFTPMGSVVSGTHPLSELREVLRDRVTFVESWLARAKEILKYSDPITSTTVEEIK